MKYKNSFLALLFFSAIAFLACNGNKDAQQARIPQLSGYEGVAFAHIAVDSIVDMGVFDYDTPVKTQEVVVSNTGDAPLYLSTVAVECECTKICSVDSLVAPGEQGKIVVELDMNGYLTDTIFKSIHITSNDPERPIVFVELLADCRL